MTPLIRSLETLKSNLGEVRSTLETRTAQAEGIAAIAQIVMPALKDHSKERAKFQHALRSRSNSADTLYRGLFVASISSFEGFIKMFVSSLVQIKSTQFSKFSDLPETFQKQYVARASQVLSNIDSGTVKGIPYSFSTLQYNIGICFANDKPPILDGDVFTILMGNPTWGRLEVILKSIGIKNPFDQSFGANDSVRRWGNAGWSKNLSEAEKKLDSLLNKRNMIVHAAHPVTIVEQDVVDACDFFEALASGLVDVMPNRMT